MKNKIIAGSIAFALLLIGFVGITNADFTNISSVDRESHRTIMNKLMDGETLSADEQVLLDEMKVQRDERETFKAERQAQRTELEPIIAKKRAGETLTIDEQAKLDAFTAERQANGNRGLGGRGGMMGGKSGTGKGFGGYDGACPYAE